MAVVSPVKASPMLSPGADMVLASVKLLSQAHPYHARGGGGGLGGRETPGPGQLEKAKASKLGVGRGGSENGHFGVAAAVR